MAGGMLELACIALRDAIARREITSAAATQAVFAAIERLNPTVGAYLTLCKDTALSRAAEIDSQLAAGKVCGPLAGVPIAIKDNICTSFGTTSCGSKILQNFHAPYDATVVENLSTAGAVIVGKTNMDEFAMGSSTENSGLGKTFNPWDTSRVPGGSSGGSAAAVAARLAFAALGSDTGGSIRQPASLCGVTGLKPTYGRVSRYGLVAYGSSLDQIGPLTRSVADAALMLNVMAGHDPKDSTSVEAGLAPQEDYLAELDKPVDGLRIAIVPQFNEGASAEVRLAVTAAIESYRKAGAQVVEISMPHFEYSLATYYIIATAEASSNLARYDGVHYGYRSKDAGDYVEMYAKSRAEGFGPEVKRRIMLGTYALSSGYYDAYYLKALKVRNLIRQDFQKAFAQADCLMLPVSPTTAFKVGEKMDDPLQMYMADIYTLAVNLAGVPGMSIPCGFDCASLPIGLQIIGPAFSEAKMLRIARMFESRTDYHTKKPALVG
jgi:aspartyl-tRNA(Asn)/glutamyl-tRNA(Gln) amidotransferase subunit A